MLSDEKIEELWVDIHKGKFMHAGFNTVARAIEAAVLPEGWVAVPKEPTLAMLDCLRSDITSNLEKRYQAMLAAAPKPAQAECAVPEVIELYEKALKASWPNGATGDAFDYWNNARYLLAETTQLAPKNRGE